MGVDPEQALLKMSPLENAAIGVGAGTFEVCVLQPMLYMKNATQQGLPIMVSPKVYYRGADQASLDPTRTAIANDGMIWADTITGTHDKNHPTIPVSIGQKPADLDGVVARTAYTTTHMMTWKEKVSGYLVTKAIAAGVMLVAALLVLLGHAAEQAAVGVVPSMVAGVFLGITGVLLIADLKQPTRFHYLLTRGNTDSWLVKGAYVLMFFAAKTKC